MADTAQPQPDACSPAEVRPAWKRVVLNYWTPIVLGVALLVPHAWWFALCSADTRSEPVAGFGALMIVLGLLVAARPFVLTGIRGTARQSVPVPYLGTFAMPEGHARRTKEAHERRISKAVPGVIAERVVAVIVVAVGTLVNGYSALLPRGIAKLFGL
jgi:hypothetical protein